MPFTNYVTVSSDKSKWTAFFLCLFGGWLGLHQFYVGKIGKGLLYAFTFGLFMFGWFADCVRILTGSFRDSSGAPLRH